MGDKKTLYTSPPANKVGPPPPKKSLIEVICTKDQKSDSKDWTKWFHNPKVPNEAKLDQLHYRNSVGYSVLHYAALHYRPDILSVALEITGVNFNVETRDSDGLTPLLVAAKNSRKNAVLWLLQDGANSVNIHAVDGQKRNAIHLAALDMQCQYTIEPLVRQLGDELCFERDQDGNTPLHLAAQKGNMQAIENGLLSSEIWDEDDDSDEEEEDSEEKATPEDMDTDMKKMIRILNDKNQTALHVAVEKGHPLVVRKMLSVYPEALLLTDKSDNLPIHLACKSGRVDIVKELLCTTVEDDSRRGKMRQSKLRTNVKTSLKKSNMEHEETRQLVEQLAQRNREVASILTVLRALNIY